MKVEERLKELNNETAQELNKLFLKINYLYCDGSTWADVGSASKVLEDLRNINLFLAGE